MWIPTTDELGRVYYYNNATDDVQWENPWNAMLWETQKFAEEVLEVSKRRHLLGCAHMGLTFRLRRMFARWVDVMTSTRVQSACETFDAWMKMRQTLLFVLGKKEEMLEQIVVYKLKCTELEEELAKTKVKEAELEFERLSKHAKLS